MTVEPGPGGRAPALTVVIAAPPRAPSVEACLGALARQEEGALLIGRVVVARSGGLPPPAVPARLGGRVRLVEGPPGAAEPVLWLCGLALTETPYLAFLDSLALPDPDWAAQIVAALEGGVDVVGGAMEPAGQAKGAIAASFLCDYGAFLPPLAPRGVGEPESLPSLPGNNIAFRTDLLRRASPAEGGLRKALLLPRLAADGAVVRRCPGARVRLRGASTSATGALRERFARGRAYAGLAAREWPVLRRLLRVLGTPLVPGVLLLRLARDLRGKPADRQALRRSLASCLALQAAWAGGEAVGLLAGPGEVTGVR